jgi:hypothetical protein
MVKAGPDPAVDHVSEPAPAGRSPTRARKQGNQDDQDEKEAGTAPASRQSAIPHK